MNTRYMEILRDILKYREPDIIIDDNGSYREASVLIPVFERDKRVYILFTKRSSQVEHHKGQISFPGGGVDSSDPTLEYTALREAYEEIGLREKDVELLGRLDDTITFASRYIVHPFVGLIPYPYSFKINRKEVEKLISVPLDFFLQDGLPKVKTIHYDGKIYNTLAYEYHGEIIWGATARIVTNLIEILSGRSSAG